MAFAGFLIRQQPIPSSCEGQRVKRIVNGGLFIIIAEAGVLRTTRREEQYPEMQHGQRHSDNRVACSCGTGCL